MAWVLRFVHYRTGLALWLLLSIACADKKTTATFEWPDSSHYWRALVNVNQYIANRPPAWFSEDKLVTDFRVTNIASRSAGEKQYDEIRSLLESRGMYVGTYVSGATVMPASELTTYPPAAVALEEMPANARYVGSWPGNPDRKIVDLGDENTRHALHAAIKQLWLKSPAPLRFVDNAGIHPAVARQQAWSDYCTNIREIRSIAESQGSRPIFNISAHVGMMSDEETRQLIDAVGNGGIALEMPWHPVVQQSKEATKKAEFRYRQLLDSGMAIIMIPVRIREDALAKWVMTWRKPTDHLYVSGAFWKQPDQAIYHLP